MNDDLIFFKTPAGEEAMRERTRLVQRNLRMVLTPVDGVTNVAALKESVGDPAMVEASLAELDRMGLIETAEAHAARAGLAGGVSGTADAAAVAQGAPEVGYDAAKAPAAGDDRTPTPAAQSLLKRFVESRQTRDEKNDDGSDEAIFDFGDGDFSHGVLEPAVAARAEAEKVAPPRKIKIRIRPLLIGVGVLLLAGIAWQLFIRSYDTYRPDFEAALSRLVDDSVAVGKVRVDYLPVPAILLEDVKVGAPAYASIAAVRLASEPWDFLGAHHRFRRVTIEGMRLADADLLRVTRWLSQGRMADVRVGRLDIENLTLDLGRGTLAGLAGKVEIDDRGSIEKIVFRSGEGTLEAELRPAADGWLLALAANGWRAPVEPAALFSKLDLRGRLSPGHFTIDELTSRACDGLVVGGGTIDWQRMAELSLSLEVQHLTGNCLLTTLGSPPLLEGETNASVAVSASAPSLDGLAKAWQLEGKFAMGRGALKRMDLADALRKRASGSISRGGSTPFEELRGTVSVNDRVVRVASVRLASGLMQAYGQATVSRQAATIAGEANVELRGTAESLRAPLVISGSASDPELKAAR